MEIPGLGEVTKDATFDWYYSRTMPVRVLSGKDCRIVVEGYDEDPAKDEIHTAIANFLQISPTVLKDAEQHLHRYYLDCEWFWSDCDSDEDDTDDEESLKIKAPA